MSFVDETTTYCSSLFLVFTFSGSVAQTGYSNYQLFVIRKLQSGDWFINCMTLLICTL